jgi:hypothetical protein
MTKTKKCGDAQRAMWLAISVVSAACAPVPPAQGAQAVAAVQRIARTDERLDVRRETVRYLDQPWVHLKAMHMAAAPLAESPAAQPPQRWEVQLSDGTLSRALTRWADLAGLQLVWDAPLDKPAMRAEYEGSFEEAVEKLMIDTKATAYELHACAYRNAIRILHVSQTCKR